MYSHCPAYLLQLHSQGRLIVEEKVAADEDCLIQKHLWRELQQHLHHVSLLLKAYYFQ